MKNKAIAAVAIVGLVAVGVIVLDVVFEDERSKTVINISPRTGGPGPCMATTVNQLMRGHLLRSVTWTINDPSQAACLPADTEVELRFVNDDSPFLVARPKNKTQIKRRVVPWAEWREYTYKVFAVNADGSEYEMEDPKLEIVF